MSAPDKFSLGGGDRFEVCSPRDNSGTPTIVSYQMINEDGRTFSGFTGRFMDTENVSTGPLWVVSSPDARNIPAAFSVAWYQSDPEGKVLWEDKESGDVAVSRSGDVTAILVEFSIDDPQRPATANKFRLEFQDENGTRYQTESENSYTIVPDACPAPTS